jgi:hypothetical protein
MPPLPQVKAMTFVDGYVTAMTHIEIGDMTVEELYIAVERHMAEAEMHMGTAEALLEMVSIRDTPSVNRRQVPAHSGQNTLDSDCGDRQTRPVCHSALTGHSALSTALSETHGIPGYSLIGPRQVSMFGG